MVGIRIGQNNVQRPNQETKCGNSPTKQTNKSQKILSLKSKWYLVSRKSESLRGVLKKPFLLYSYSLELLFRSCCSKLFTPLSV